ENGLEETSTRFAEAIVFDEEEPDNLYLGLRSGELYATRDGGDSWAALGVTVPPDITTMRCVRA
ncbi:MAG: exo-alpha-sialidase, partial [Planctomycetes bacterium]|nr:exo-alpha-sialidase [Planctomycetota bacterium]